MRISIADLHFTYPANVEALRGVSLTIELGYDKVSGGKAGKPGGVCIPEPG